MKKSYIKTIMLYTFGVLAWIILISVLKLSCIGNVPFFFDGLWTKDIDEYFIEYVTGSIAFKASKFGCDNTYIYTADYFPDGMNGNYERKILNSFVDLGSFKELESDNISATYGDISHKYILYHTSDGVYMRIFSKDSR